jgi:hypothetical protein
MGAGASVEDAKKYGTQLYHQTDDATAQSILRTQQMKPGSKGLAGGGIYFATTEEQTGHKAHAHGVTLKAYVRLGRILTLESEGDRSMTFEKLHSKGFDSVCIARSVSSGHEYVVYDPAQVLYIERSDTDLRKSEKRRKQEAVFCVGPIWNDGEASKKANAWIKAEKPGEGWEWTGQWWSKGGTSYCQYSR